MARFLARRLGGTIPVLLLISFLVFLLLHAAPGDPATLLVSNDATPQDIAEIRARWGLDQPLYLQYLKFVFSAAHGSFGTSFRYGEPVLPIIASRLPATMELAALATVIAVGFGVPFGLWAGARPNSWVDNVASLLGFFGISMPGFWMGIMLILIVAGYMDLLPTSLRETFGVSGAPITGFLLIDSLLHGDGTAFLDALSHLALPAITLGTHMIGIIMRVTRSSVREIMHEDYIVTVRAKGLPEWLVLWRHVLRNALVVILTVVGLELGTLLSGSIIVETIFSWPGTGSLLIEALSGRDYPMIIGLVLVYTTLFVLINLVIDFCYAALDPRLRFE